MAKDLNTPNLSIVAEDDGLKIVSINGEARLGAVYLDGKRLEGVYSEVRSGHLGVVSSDSAEMVEVPSGLKARDAFLKKWSVAAQNTNKVKKAGGASMLLLTLAACGGDGGDSVVVTGDIVAPNDIVQISSAVVGAVVTVVSNLTRGELFSNIEINAEGEGTLTLSFEDAADVVMLSENTDISGFDTIVVEHGTVDFTAVDLPSSVTILQVGSSATLSLANYEQLDKVELRAGATEGSITVVADTFADILSIDAHDIASAEVSVSVATSSELNLTVGQAEDLGSISVEFVGEFSVVDTADALLAADPATLTEANLVEVLGGDAGNLSVENVAALRAVTTTDTWTFDVDDVVENVFNGNNIIEAVRETLLNADSVSISGELNESQVTTLEALNSNLEVDPFVTAIEISDATLSIGDTATVTVTFSEAVTGLEIANFAAANASLSNLSSATDNSDGTQSYTLTLTPDASIEDTTNVVTLASGAVLDAANNANAGSATSSNYTIDTLAPSAPSFALANDTGTDGDGISSDGIVNVSGLEAGATWEYLVDGGASWTAGSGTAFTLPEGSYAIGDIQVRQYDAAGNLSGVNVNLGVVEIDATNPTVVSIEISDTALSIGDTATVTITFSEAVTGLEIADFAAQNASLSNLSTATDNLDGTQSYTLNLTPGASIEDTTNVVTLAPGAVLDAASNANAGSATTPNYAVDTSAPSAPSFALASDTGTDGDDISSDGIVNVSGLEAGATWEYLVDGGASWTAGSGTAFSLSEGSYAIGDIQVRQYDAAGNVGVVHQNSGVVIIDTTSPTVVSVVLADNSFFLDGNTQTTVASEQTTVTITFAEAVAVIDLTVGDFTVDNGTLSNLAAVNASNGYASEFTVTLTADDLSSPDASNSIQLEANVTADKAGNTNVASTVVNFSIDKDVSATWADFVGTDTLAIDGVEDAAQSSTLTITDVPDAARIENDEARLFNTTDNGDQNSIRGVESIVFEVVADGSVDFDLGANAEDAGIDAVTITGDYDASVLNLGGRNSGGEAVTGSGNDQITGSNLSDVIESGSGQDVLDGGEGGDTFKFATAHLDSADVVDGGDGHDTIVITNDANLEDGDFTNVTSVETLTLSSTGSNDVILGAEVNRAGIRLIDATASADGSNIDISGFAASMTVHGGSGDDNITGGSGRDTLFGYEGDDVFIVTENDKISGGDGNDTVRFDASVSATNLSNTELVNVEKVEITNTGDAAYDFSAQTESLTISGNTGDDTITGGSAADSIAGGNGDDV
ncbi:Ig-like domain-containing protein, partial [Octadecabacter sp.]|nr:Ig-like domain-containing protein [Octadecabacter sp.]